MNPASLPDKSTALILGNGPSVDLIQPDSLKRFTTYGCNHIYKKFPQWGFPTDNVVITDSNRIREIGQAYANFKGGLFVGDQRYVNPPISKIQKILGRDFIPLRQLKKDSLQKFAFLDNIPWHPLLFTTVFNKTRFSFQFQQGFNFGHSVVISAIQIAVINGHKNILITGVDSNYQTPKDYFAGAGESISYVNEFFVKNPRVYMEPILVLLQIYLERLGIQLLDCTPKGHLRFISKGEFSNSSPYFKIIKTL